MDKKTVVKKYGGTSVETIFKIREIAKDAIKKAKKKKIVIVVSAMAGETKRLKQLAQKASDGKVPFPPEKDKLLATGEERSASLLVIAINSLGGEAVSLTGFQIGLETNEVYGNGKIVGIQNINKIKELLERDKIVVVAGFQGVAKGSDRVITLGKGGSDLTAIALAGELNTDCEICTDVDGVFAIDPRIVPEAKRLKNITYRQMLQFSAVGAEVLMYRAVLLAQSLGVEIRVLLSPSLGKTTGGTLIRSGNARGEIENLIYQTVASIQKEIVLVEITDVPNQPGMATKIYKVLSNAGINIVDAVQGQGKETANISILFQTKDTRQALSALRKIKGVNIKGSSDVATLTIINPIMKEEPFFYRATKSMSGVGVNIEMMGSSATSIMLAIKKENLKKAAQSLAKEFNLLE